MSLGEVVVSLGQYGSETPSRVTQLKIGDICLLVGSGASETVLGVDNAKLGIKVFGSVSHNIWLKKVFSGASPLRTYWCLKFHLILHYFTRPLVCSVVQYPAADNTAEKLGCFAPTALELSLQA